jgi:tetratricopeptide (TPR) repeat protein
MKKIIFILVILFIAFLSCNIIFAQTQSEELRLEAQKQMQFGRYGEAIDLLNRYISAEPQKALGYNLRGMCYEKRKDYENAVYDYRSALKLEPNNKEFQTNLNRATSAWYSLLYNNIEGYKREVAINRNKAVNYLEIGKCYKNLGNWLMAEDWYDQYLSREEASADEIIRYTEILAKNNHIAKGEPILEKYIEKYPNDHRLWSRYGYFSLWLGKNKVAIDAFEHALALKPYFKEAQAGLDQAKGNGYIYAINDTSFRYYKGSVRKIFVYPIDRDYRLLKKNPDNNELRFKLVKELVEAKRYVEALNQLDILSRDTTSKIQEYQKYQTELKASLKKIYQGKIDEYSALLRKNPTNKKAVMILADYYDKAGDYDSGMAVLDNYLSKTESKENNDVKYLYARLAAENKDFIKALSVMDELLKSEPDNYSYKLFDAQLSVWQGKNLDEVKPVLKNMVAKNPKDLQATIALASLTIQQRDFEESTNLINRVKELDPTNPAVNQLESDFDEGKIVAEQARLFDILQEGRQLSYENHCQEALKKYKEYMASTPPSVLVQKEYADVNVCAKNYTKAIEIYNDLLKRKYDYEIDLMRAKTYYYMRDSIDALKSFQRLAKEKPGDFTTNLYLGDSYSMMRQFSEAENVYMNMRENMKLDSSQVALIEQRESWLPKPGFGSETSALLSYGILSPYGSYYGDNFGFRLNNQGLRVDVGITSFLMVGVEGFRTALSNDSVNQNINSIKVNMLIQLAKNLSFGIGFGNSIYQNSGNKTIANSFIRAEDAEKYSATLSINRQDAGEILFSPNLVSTRENVDNTRFIGYYLFDGGVKLSTDLNFLSLTDGNSGRKINLRLGKYFFPEILIGYEYENLNYLFHSAYYYSPQNYSSHSLFGDFDIYKSDNKLSKITTGGKLGVISNSSYIIRQIYISFNWNPVQQFSLQGYMAYGSTYQSTVGYSSFSAYFSAYWNF